MSESIKVCVVGSGSQVLAAAIAFALKDQEIETTEIFPQKAMNIHNYYPVGVPASCGFHKERTYPTLRQHIRGRR